MQKLQPSQPGLERWKVRTYKLSLWLALGTLLFCPLLSKLIHQRLAGTDITNSYGLALIAKLPLLVGYLIAGLAGMFRVIAFHPSGEPHLLGRGPTQAKRVWEWRVTLFCPLIVVFAKWFEFWPRSADGRTYPDSLYTIGYGDETFTMFFGSAAMIILLWYMFQADEHLFLRLAGLQRSILLNSMRVAFYLCQPPLSLAYLNRVYEDWKARRKALHASPIGPRIS